MDYYESDYVDYEDYDMEHVQFEQPPSGPSFLENVEFCMKPSLDVWTSHALVLVISCIVCKQLSLFFFQWRHFILSFFGLFILFYFFDLLAISIISHVFISYLLLLLLPKLFPNWSAHVFSVSNLLFLIICEFLVKVHKWQKIRSPHMLMAMKVISLAYDLKSQTLKSIPTLGEFFGYSLSVGSCIFGPWVSFKDHLVSLEKNSLTLENGLKIIEKSFLSLIFLLISSCLLDWLIPETSNSWAILYRRALTIRTSHYFISTLSELTVLLIGLTPSWQVTSPQKIELPYSLLQVVIHWNIPMHNWLKQYVFQTSRIYGGFFSILMTYIVSTALHGFNFRLGGILISLGVYTYVEYRFRKKLALTFDACVAAKPCPDQCLKHRYSSRSISVKLFNICCTIIAIFHLTYLGILMDFPDGNASHNSLGAFNDWTSLNFISHWIVLGVFIFQFLF